MPPFWHGTTFDRGIGRDEHYPTDRPSNYECSHRLVKIDKLVPDVKLPSKAIAKVGDYVPDTESEDYY